MSAETLEQQQARPDKATEAERLAKSTDLNLPRCTWLGFRDGDKAILATLAVYNRKQNYYIFVDRYGKKVRQLSGAGTVATDIAWPGGYS